MDASLTIVRKWVKKTWNLVLYLGEGTRDKTSQIATNVKGLHSLLTKLRVTQRKSTFHYISAEKKVKTQNAAAKGESAESTKKQPPNKSKNY